MSSLVLTGDTSGQVTVSAPAIAGSNTLSLQAATATMSVNTLSTAVATTSGTSITFSSIPSWVKRVTVMFNGVSTSGTSNPIIQVGSGSVTTSGYTGLSWRGGAASNNYASNSAGFILDNSNTASSTIYGHLILTLISGSTYICSGSTIGGSNEGNVVVGSISLSGALDRVVLTATNGTDTFDAGTVNLLYEG